MKYLAVLLFAVLLASCKDGGDVPDAIKNAIKAGNGVVKISNESTQQTPNGSWTFSKRPLSAEQSSVEVTNE